MAGHSNHLTPLQWKALLNEEPTSRFSLVEFRTSFSATCIQASSVLPELSNIYSNKSISFGIIVLGHFPNAAAKFGISMWDHLPTYILFDKTTEVARFPEITSESKKLLCQHFDLDRRLIEYLSRLKIINRTTSAAST
uniref:Thioredoxin domain-containing protein n=1 Tax=Oryza punctata TaxID=4537 RepID=A0A0E0K7F4_ORYPU